MAAADESPKSQGGGADQSHQREAQPADADEVAENRDNVDRQQGQSRPADDGTGINPRRQQKAAPRPVDDRPGDGRRSSGTS